MLDSCAQPEFSISTEKARSLVDSTVFVSLGESCWRAGKGSDAHDPGAARGTPCATAGRRSPNALPDAGHRAPGGDVRVREEVRVGNLDPGDVLPFQLVGRRVLEQVVPDDVAGDEPLRLYGQEATSGIGIRGRGRLAKRLGHAAERVEPEVESLDRVTVLCAQRPGRVERAELVGLLLLLLRQAFEPLLDLRRPLAAAREDAVQVATERLRVVRQRRRSSRRSRGTRPCADPRGTS